MKKTVLLLLILPVIAFSQQQTSINKFAEADYTAYFQEAYQLNPSIPKGVLEAVAYGNTHIYNIVHTQGENGNCMGLPLVYGVMGLTLDGKNYFNNNLVYVSNLSGISTAEIINNPEKNILAYASAFNSVMNSIKNQKAADTKTSDIIFSTLIALSELPHTDEGQIFALNTQLYSYFTFLNSPEFQTKYNFPDLNFDLQTLFGEDNYKVLSSSHVTISDEEISDEEGNQYKAMGNNNQTVQSADYTPAIWNAAASCNFSSRTAAITAVVIHDVEGSYASCISWFKNCSANVSAHYVVRSSDGQITQMVLESKKAWHVGSENGYTIGIEHEGFQAQSGWYTPAMYQSSANLVKDICISGYGINPTTCWSGASCNGSCVLSSAYKIKGHQHYPNQTHDDPGLNWNWGTYYNLINGAPSCGTPSGLTAASITLNSAVLNWTSVPSATSYNVQYKPTSSSTWTTVSSSTTSKAISGLTASTSYQFKVQAVCTSTGPYSSVASFTTTSSTSTNTTLTIGTATTPYSAHPYGTVYMDERVQYIIKKSELTTAGWGTSSPFLKSISFYVSSAAPQPMGSFTITMAHTTGSQFASTTFLSGSNSQTVYSGTATAAQGWNTYTFSTPFNYNGTDNLLISICWNNSSFTVNSAVYANSYSTYVGLYYRADLASSGACGKTTGTKSYYRPNTKLEFSSSSSFLMPDEAQQQKSLELSSSSSINEAGFEIFPNPLNGEILYGKVTNIENTNMTIIIYDMLGRELLSKEVAVEGGNFSLSFADESIKTGVYMVVGLTDTNRFTKRVVVK